MTRDTESGPNQESNRRISSKSYWFNLPFTSIPTPNYCDYLTRSGSEGLGQLERVTHIRSGIGIRIGIDGLIRPKPVRLGRGTEQIDAQMRLSDIYTSSGMLLWEVLPHGPKITLFG